jgi:hypothetical protein
MPSPFPGMDPYLEDPVRWPDMHQGLITYIRDALSPQIRPNYFARMGERVYVISPPHAMYPDVMLVQRAARETTTTYAPVSVAEVKPASAAETKPIIITLPPVEHREPFIEIVHAAGEEIVTVIEVLSPSNKMDGERRAQYRVKQKQILESAAHLIEIDLLASGQWSIAIPVEARAQLPPHRYIISAHRATARYEFEVYPIPLASALPRVNVPLRAPDADVVLELQAVLTQCYANGGYDGLIDYRRPPRALLSPEEAAWVDGLLRGKGIRQ